MINFFVTLLLVAAATASPDGESRSAPAFQIQGAEPLVVVATSAPGQSYAEPEKCKVKDVICTRWPLWFRVTPIGAVYGEPPAGVVEVTTYTHYGQPEADDERSPRVMLLLRNGGQYFMPTYASARIWRHSNGNYYLLVDSPYPVHWLPCSASSLRERVTASDFPTTAALPADDYSVKKYPNLFEVKNTLAFPRYGISVSRIAKHLKEKHSTVADFSCRIKDES